MFEHILAATDGSARADRALAAALKLAGGNAAVTAILVVPDYGRVRAVAFGRHGGRDAGGVQAAERAAVPGSDRRRRLAAGARTLRIHGRDVTVRAQVVQLEGLSAHADAEGLLAWLAALPRPPQRVLINHGEPVAADLLRQAVERRLGWPAAVADEREAVEV
jgi:nucleotide-binding universal stress UspA family protein